MNFNSIILTSYFTAKRHPQCVDPNTIGLDKDGIVENDNFDYIRDWYNSVLQSGACGVVFHDFLSKEFVEEYRDANMKFIRVNGDYHNYSLNDARFFYYYDFFKENEVFLKCPIFMTDAADVIVRNPPKDLDKKGTLYVGDEEGKVLTNYISSFGGGNYWSVSKYFGWHDLQENYPLLNAGIVGGNLTEVGKFLKLYNAYRLSAKNEKLNINMPLINYIVRKYWGNNVIHGEPLNSEFKKFEDRADVYFTHK